MRHHRRAEDAEREVEHLRIADDLGRRRETANHLSPIGIGERDLDRKAQRDHAEQRDHQSLDPAESELLQIEDQEDVERRDDDAELERNAEDQVEPDRRADHLGDVGGDDRDLGQEPQDEGNRLRIGGAAGLGEVAAGGDGKAGAQRLQHDRHDIGDQRDDEERVAELRAARERGRPVAGIHVADGDEIARPDEGGGAPPAGAGLAHRDRAVDV